MLCALTATLAGAAPAAAQAPADADYAGGNVVDADPGKRFNGRVGDSAVSLSVTDNGGDIQAAVVVLHACGGGAYEVSNGGMAPVASDGTFRVPMRRTFRDGRTRVTETVTLIGKLEGPRASGTLTSTSRRGKQRCKGSTTWAAVQPPQPAAAPTAPVVGALLLGVITRANRLPYQVLMRLTADGKRIRRMNLNLPWTCDGRESVLTFYELGSAIRPDGTFTYSAPFTGRFSRTIERGRVRVNGQFTADGATGTVEVSSTVRSRRGKRGVVDRCKSGRRVFAAIP